MAEKEHKQALIELGVFIATKRQQMGRTQAELAAFVGISENTLMRIENGRFYYDLKLLFKILEALEIKPYFVPLEHEGEFSSDIFNITLN